MARINLKDFQNKAVKELSETFLDL